MLKISENDFIYVQPIVIGIWNSKELCRDMAQ